MKKRKKVRTTASLTAKIEKARTVPLEDIIPDCRPLLVALILSSPDECLRIRQDHPGDALVDTLINYVHAFRSDNNLWNLYAEDGFFTEQLEYILAVAKKDRTAGARLMPVFCSALTDARHLKIPDALQSKIIDHINWQRRKDGFAIKELSFSKTLVVPADDVAFA